MSSVIEIDVLTANLNYELADYKKFLATSKQDDLYFKILRDGAIKTYRYAICLLLGKTDVQKFFSQLVQAARYKKQLHEECRPYQKYWRYALGSQYIPVLGAVLAGEEALAMQLAAVSAYPFDEDYEYEEDYICGTFFYQWISHHFTIGDYIEPIMEKLGELEEDGSARFLLMQALLDNNNSDFNQAMEQLIDEHEAFYDLIEDTLSVNKEKFTTEKAVHIEALAWLNIAKRHGLSVNTDYRYIPAILTVTA